MPYTLQAPESRTITIDHAQVTSFSVDPQRAVGHLAYELRDASGAKLADRVIVLSGTDFQALVQRINAIQAQQTTSDSYAAQKQAFYERIETEESWSGGAIS